MLWSIIRGHYCYFLKAIPEIGDISWDGENPPLQTFLAFKLILQPNKFWMVPLCNSYTFLLNIKKKMYTIYYIDIRDIIILFFSFICVCTFLSLQYFVKKKEKKQIVLFKPIFSFKAFFICLFKTFFFFD